MIMSMLLRSLYVYCMELKEMVPRVLTMRVLVFCESEI